MAQISELQTHGISYFVSKYLRIRGSRGGPNKIEVLNLAGPRESKEPGVYGRSLTLLRFLNRASDPQKPPGE
jgi:hypothetical protein